MAELTKGDIQSIAGGNEYTVLGPFTANKAITATDVVQLTTEGTVQLAPADATEALGFALGSYTHGATNVYVAWGGNTTLVMSTVAGEDIAASDVGLYYALAGATGAQTLDKGDDVNHLLVPMEVDVAKDLSRVRIVPGALQLDGKEVAATETAQ